MRKSGLILLVGVFFASISGWTLAGQMALTPTTASVSGLETLGLIDRNFSPLVRKARNYCNRDCRWCRNDCYNTYRINCFHQGCRQQFVLCMRGCWENICRYC